MSSIFLKKIQFEEGLAMINSYSIFRGRNSVVAIFLILTIAVFSACSAKLKWTRADYALAVALVATQTADGYTTDKIINDYDGYQKYPICMGGQKHPSTESIILWKSLQTGAILGLAHIAPVINPKLRKFILGFGIAVSGYCAIDNQRTINDIE